MNFAFTVNKKRICTDTQYDMYCRGYKNICAADEVQKAKEAANEEIKLRRLMSEMEDCG